MTLAIMQPYLFPYIGYWQLIVNCDRFIFFDVVQFNKKSWMNRNRILHPNPAESFQYISVPVKHNHHGELIQEVIIDNSVEWGQKILGQLTYYKKLNAPYYSETVEVIEKVLLTHHEQFISLIIDITKRVLEYLELPFHYGLASELDFDRSTITGPGDWALAISKYLKADRYINPPGGYTLFDEANYMQNGIALQFLKSNLTPYKQSKREKFVPGLSIIDVMMFNGKDEIRNLLKNDFKLLNQNDLMETSNVE